MSETTAGEREEAPPPASGGDPVGVSGSALRSGVLRGVLTAEALSSLGGQMSYLALPWFVLVTTGSATRMGLVFAVELLPIALLGIPSGLLMQRLGARRTILMGDLARGPLVAAVPVLHALGLLSFPVLLALVFLVGAFSAPYIAAQRLLIPLIFKDDERLVVQGNGLLDGVVRFATLIGPAAAGLLIGAIGAVNVLYVDAATYLASFAILFAALPRRRPAVTATGAEQQGIWAGARFVLRTPLLLRVSVGALLYGFFFPPLLASLPVITTEEFGGDPRTAGLLYSAWGAGAVLGILGVMRYASRVPPLRMGALAGVGVALPLWLLALPHHVMLFAAVLFVSGVFTPMLNAPVVTLIMLRAPESIRPQVMAFVMTANLLAGPLGFALAGPALDQLGITPVLLIVAAGVTLAALTLLSLVRQDSPPRAVTPESSEV
jgi:MFS family permease